MTKIISSFPCTGKTSYCKEHQFTTLDMDSSAYKCPPEEFNHWGDYYFAEVDKAVKEDKYEYIFISTHIEIRSRIILSPLINHLEVYVPMCGDPIHNSIHRIARDTKQELMRRIAKREDSVDAVGCNFSRYMDNNLSDHLTEMYMTGNVSDVSGRMIYKRMELISSNDTPLFLKHYLK